MLSIIVIAGDRQPDLEVIKIGSFGSVSPPTSIWEEAGCGRQCSCRVSTIPPLPPVSFSHHFTGPLIIRAPPPTPDSRGFGHSVPSEKFRSLQLLSPARVSSLVLSRPSPASPFCSCTDRRPRASRQSTHTPPVLFTRTCVVNLCACVKLRPNVASLGKSLMDPSKQPWFAAWDSFMKTPCAFPSDS